MIGTLVRVEHFLKTTVPIVPLAILLAAVVLFIFSKTSKEREEFKKISHLVFGIGIAFLIVGFLLSAGVKAVLDASAPKSTDNIGTDPVSCEKNQNQNDRDSCFSNVAPEKKDASVCEKIQNQESKDSCYGDVAPAKQVSSLCDKISNQTSKDSCFESVAPAKQDPSLCEKISDKYIKNDCYSNMARIINDASLCENVLSPTPNIANISKDRCYFDVAIRDWDSFFVPIPDQNPMICEKIENPAVKTACIAMLTKDPSQCSEVMTLTDLCYMNVGMAKQDLSICDKACGRWMCYLRVAVYKKDPSICPQIGEPNMVGACYNGIAEATKNPDVCEKIDGYKDDCYQLARP